MIEFLKESMVWIKENIGWVKDFITLIFAATATIVGVLTYRRARFTLLQPIRNETIKKQADTLAKLLDFLRANDDSFEIGIDYLKIIRITTFLSLRDYGFIISGQESFLKNIEKECIGSILCGNSDKLDDVEIIQTFKTTFKNEEKSNIGKEKFELLKEGVAEIDKVHITKTYSDFMKELSSFINDPFIPKRFVAILEQYASTIQYNITIVVKEEIEKFLVEFGKYYFANEKAPQFNPIGIYNSFNRTRKRNDKVLHSLRNEIREYMLIDKTW